MYKLYWNGKLVRLFATEKELWNDCLYHYNKKWLDDNYSYNFNDKYHFVRYYLYNDEYRLLDDWQLRPLMILDDYNRHYDITGKYESMMAYYPKYNSLWRNYLQEEKPFRLYRYDIPYEFRYDPVPGVCTRHYRGGSSYHLYGRFYSEMEDESWVDDLDEMDMNPVKTRHMTTTKRITDHWYSSHSRGYTYPSWKSKKTRCQFGGNRKHGKGSLKDQELYYDSFADITVDADWDENLSEKDKEILKSEYSSWMNHYKKVS